jgi:hypothetical protein
MVTCLASFYTREPLGYASEWQSGNPETIFYSFSYDAQRLLHPADKGHLRI